MRGNVAKSRPISSIQASSYNCFTVENFSSNSDAKRRDLMPAKEQFMTAKL